jgi:putative heme transporter
MRVSGRTLLSLITLALLGVIIAASWKEITHAWLLLGKVDIWVLLLLVPLQIISYYAAGEMIFTYLRDKDPSMRKVSYLATARMSLELNFVNHILPSGGVAGMSYMTWRLNKLGISSGRAAMAQVVRYMVSFLAFITLLVISVIMITLDEGVNRVVLLASSTLVSMLVGSMACAVYIVSNRQRLTSFSHWITKSINRLVRRITFGRKSRVLKPSAVETFFLEFHDDYRSIRRDKRLLVKPYIWGVILMLVEVAMFTVGFLAFGEMVNPAPIVIAYGLASFAGFILFTPGGAGGYEAIMIAFLALAGISQSAAIAAIVLTRVVLLAGTIVTGYIFYQLTLLRYGKRPTER